MSYLHLRESYPSYQCHGDDVISHVTVAKKDALAHCKNRLLSIQKQITCPDGIAMYCQLTSGILKLRWLCTGAFPRGLVRRL